MSILAAPLDAKDAQSVEIRILGEEDANAFRAIRLEALQKDGRYFTANYKAEARRSSSDWAKACKETCDHAVFGAFVENKLVGVMSATKWDADASGRSVKWGSSYVDPAWRRSGVGAALYASRELWTVERGFDQAVFTIRADNARSIEIHTDNGAELMHSTPMRFADRTVAPTNWYRRRLKADTLRVA